MEQLHFKGSKKTPEIFMNKADGVISITGRSVHENASEFYDPLEKWINEYCLNPAEETKITIGLNYFNSSSFRSIRNILLTLDRMHKKGHKVEVVWQYEVGDVSTRESGEMIRENTSLNFTFVEVDE